MPRVPRVGMSNRRFGIEMEGYVETYPRNMSIQGASIKRDGSLSNNSWRPSMERFGVEIVSRPIKTYSIIDRIFGEMSNYNWSTDNRAGTHVHVEINDFDEYEKMKLLRFCKGIEDIMFMFVRDYRNENRYCPKLGEDWKRVFTNENIHMLESLKGVIRNSYLTFDTLSRMGLRNAHNGKYYWVNVYGTPSRPTVEFRIFHAVESAQEALGFVKLACAIVDTVKNSTVEQLEFIITALHNSKTAEDIAKNLYYAIGLEYEVVGLPLVGTNAIQDMEDILAVNRNSASGTIAI